MGDQFVSRNEYRNDTGKIVAVAFGDVPERAKAPLGPYHQAPPEFGSEWWPVYPFSQSPWLRHYRAPDAPAFDPAQLPEGFVDCFPRPLRSDFYGLPNEQHQWQQARDQWQLDLLWWVRAGAPPTFSAEQIALADETFKAWRLGSPRYFETRDGWFGCFPGVRGIVPRFLMPAWILLTNTHGAISTFQMAALRRGIVPEPRHPYVPDWMWRLPETGEDELANMLAGEEAG